LTVLDLLLQRIRQGIGVDLESDRQGGFWTHAITDPSIFGAGNGLVKLQRVAPERFVAKRVVAKNLAALVDHALRVLPDQAISARSRCWGASCSCSTDRRTSLRSGLWSRRSLTGREDDDDCGQRHRQRGKELRFQHDVLRSRPSLNYLD